MSLDTFLRGVGLRADGKKIFYGIGINKYQRSQLQGCVNDVRNMVSYLAPKGFEIQTLLDAEATRDNMLLFWSEAVSKVGSDDLLVLHYSGHGSEGPSTTESDHTDECMVSVEMKPVWDNEFGVLLQGVNPRGQIVVVLDCCHSQTGTRFVTDSRVQLSVPRAVPFRLLDPVPPEDFGGLTHRALASSRNFPIVELAACQSWDVTYDAPQPDGSVQGCYTRALIDSATELDSEQNWFSRGYTVKKLQERIGRRLPNEDYPNRPQLLASDHQRRWVMWRPNATR